MFFLFNRRENEIAYVFKGLILGILVSLPIVEFVHAFYPEAKTVEMELTLTMIIIATLVGPIIETLVMIFVLDVIKCFTNKLLLVCFISALFWGLLHSSNGSLHGLFVFPGFLIYSIAYQVWRKVSAEKAFYIVASMHILHNSLVVLVVKLFA